jgi:hypothetical protein
MELVFKRVGCAIRLTENEVFKIHRDSRTTLIEEIKREEDIAMFIVNHKRLAKLPEGFPGEDLTLGHISVGPHPNVALHVMCNLPELHNIYSRSGIKLVNAALNAMGPQQKEIYYALRALSMIRRT